MRAEEENSEGQGRKDPAVPYFLHLSILASSEVEEKKGRKKEIIIATS